MTKLWKKSGKKTHPAVNNYIVSKNCEQDSILLPYDVQASMAHAKMLHKVGLLSKKEENMLVKGLKEIEALYTKGKFQLKQSDEDCHTAIENYLTKKFGDVGKKIHTGRSRNDQVLTAIRLFSKQQLTIVKKELLKTAEQILAFAKKNEFVPMPGYTHTQQAMPSSVGQWAGCFVEALLDDYGILESAYKLNDQNPLGSAAGFGTSLPIDRDFTTKELGFAKTQINALYCQNSRGKLESFILSGIVQVMLTLGKIANDLIWFTTKEFDFFVIDESLTTGSSIMPQKKNLDILEVLRANISIVLSCQMQIQIVSHNLLSGYNKDLKITKEALIKSFEIVISSLKIMQLVFEHLKAKKKVLSSSFSTEIFATDIVNEFVLKGMPFREAYQKVGRKLKEVKTPDFVENIKGKKHLGATGNLALSSYAEQIRRLKE
ncbi:MAG: argininosuccinate lyase [Candidatus Peregrinibacteria bacterium]|nr:argininosuccinate lyase [Candidatus Peregrinibacteria bacterium]MDZ4245365.1 argininosuccinate lyase [Candidatus Gracilibacteria bacterium]